MRFLFILSSYINVNKNLPIYLMLTSGCYDDLAALVRLGGLFLSWKFKYSFRSVLKDILECIGFPCLCGLRCLCRSLFHRLSQIIRLDFLYQLKPTEEIVCYESAVCSAVYQIPNHLDCGLSENQSSDNACISRLMHNMEIRRTCDTAHWFFVALSLH